MAMRRLAEVQPESFAFTEANVAWAEKEIAKYPEGRQASAVIALLWRAQAQEGWVTEPAIEVVAEMLDMPKIRVLEVATFYTMFNLEPVGRVAHIQVCGTTPCWLRGANDLKEVCRNRINHEPFHLSSDGAFSWEEVECLGACVNAPMVLIGSDTFEDLTAERFQQTHRRSRRRQAGEAGPADRSPVLRTGRRSDDADRSGALRQGGGRQAPRASCRDCCRIRRRQAARLGRSARGQGRRSEAYFRDRPED